MEYTETKEDIVNLVNNLNFSQKVERSLKLIETAFRKYGEKMVVANSLGKDSCVVWDLAKKVSANIPGFIVTTRYKPKATKEFMKIIAAEYPEIKIFSNDSPQPDELYKTDPDKCCYNLKVIPVREGIEEMEAECWVTGLRCTEGKTRTEFLEIEERDAGLIKLNPILIWNEREIWQYLALYKVRVNPLYKDGYRSLGCEPCTSISVGEDERAGRWMSTNKCGGECGIHTKPLKG